MYVLPMCKMYVEFTFIPISVDQSRYTCAAVHLPTYFAVGAGEERVARAQEAGGRL